MLIRLLHKSVKTLDFIKIFLEQRVAFKYYDSITNGLVNNAHSINKSRKHKTTTHCYSVFDVPSYLSTKANQGQSIIHRNTFKGSLINLKNYKDFEDYMGIKFTAKRRGQLKTYEKRLHKAFNITHEIVYGSISERKYNYLFDRFYTMLETRFIEKEMKNDEIPQWEYYRKVMYDLIQNKNAFLSVFYHNTTPISMSLNVIQGSVIYGYMKSHDINFSKFSLGFLDLKKVIHWGFQNNFEVFDFLKGKYDYKSKWVDTEYYFQKQIIYNPKSLKSTGIAKLIALEIKSFYFFIKLLKLIQIDKLYKKYTSLKYLQGTRKKIKDLKTIKSRENKVLSEDIFTNDTLLKIDIADNLYLKKPAYDFLYSENEHIESIAVYKVIKAHETYIIKGAKKMQKIKYA